MAKVQIKSEKLTPLEEFFNYGDNITQMIPPVSLK